MSIDTEGTVDNTVELTLDGEAVEVERGRPLIEVAREEGSYVPGWCHHPGMRPASELEATDVVYRSRDGSMPKPALGVSSLPDEEIGREGTAIEGDELEFDGCEMCMIEVDGDVVKACETRARVGMEVRTDTDEVRELQEEAMAELFRHHPHDCLDCPQKEGCDRITCSMNVPQEKRCCDLLGNCELEKSAEAIDLEWSDVPSYEPLDRGGQQTAVFDINWELCIGCNRCVGACEDHVGAGIWRFTVEDDSAQGNHTGATVGLRRETLSKSGCKYCTTCVDACPTGTLMDNDGGDSDKLPKEFRRSLPKVQFPESRFPLTADIVKTQVPNDGGVYRLYDADEEIVEINGVADLSAALLDEVDRNDAIEVDVELDENFTQRETELIEEYVNEHGHMPGMGGGMSDDLF